MNNTSVSTFAVYTPSKARNSLTYPSRPLGDLWVLGQQRGVRHVVIYIVRVIRCKGAPHCGGSEVSVDAWVVYSDGHRYGRVETGLEVVGAFWERSTARAWPARAQAPCVLLFRLKKLFHGLMNRRRRQQKVFFPTSSSFHLRYKPQTDPGVGS